MAEHGIYDEEPLVVGILLILILLFIKFFWTIYIHIIYLFTYLFIGKHLQIVGSSPITCYVRATIGTAAPLCTVFESGNVLLRELALIHL